MTSSFHVYLTAVITSGAGIWGAALLTEEPSSLFGPRPDLFALFCLLLLVAESRPVMWLRRKQGAVITAAPSFNAALLVLAPGLGPALASGVISAVGDATCGRPPVKTAFNAAMMSITMATTGVLLQATGARLVLVEGGHVDLLWVLSAAFAMVSYHVVNNLLVLVVVALSERTPIRPMLREAVLGNTQFDGVLLAMGPVMVVVAVRAILLVPVLVAVTVIVLNSTRIALERLHQATHDPLTGLPNRRLFDEHLTMLLDKRFDPRHPVVVMAIDLDRFKEINDTLGHETGDKVLTAVAQRLHSCLPRSGMVARLGGDEFAVLLADGPDSPDGLAALGEQVHGALTGSLHAEGLPLTIAGSVGVAAQQGDVRVVELMRAADMAMYLAKGGGGGVSVHQPGGSVVTGGRLALLDQLGPAIADGQLFVEYQPVISTLTGAAVSLEALVRWRHPELGLVPPGEFIPTAEQTDLIDPLTTFVLRQAMSDCRLFAELGHDVSVAVNLSSRSVTDPSFPRHLRSLIAGSGLPARRLTLELTENTILGDVPRAMQVLTQITDLGVAIALDDFGTGFSSLSNLRELPLDAIKVDRSFVSRMLEQPEDAAIVSTVLTLAERLGLKVVAEGIEDEAVLEALRSLGCPFAQGFHIARPMSFELAAEWLASRPRPQFLATPRTAAEVS